MSSPIVSHTAFIFVRRSIALLSCRYSMATEIPPFGRLESNSALKRDGPSALALSSMIKRWGHGLTVHRIIGASWRTGCGRVRTYALREQGGNRPSSLLKNSAGTPEFDWPSASFVKREAFRMASTRQSYVSPFTSNVSRFLGAAFSASCRLHRLLVPKHSQRPLAENPVGARKTHDQRQQHREEETAAKHPWVYAPWKVEHIPH